MNGRAQIKAAFFLIQTHSQFIVLHYRVYYYPKKVSLVPKFVSFEYTKEPSLVAEGGNNKPARFRSSHSLTLPMSMNLMMSKWMHPIKSGGSALSVLHRLSSSIDLPRRACWIRGLLILLKDISIQALSASPTKPSPEARAPIGS